MQLEVQLALAGIIGSVVTALIVSLFKFAEQIKLDKTSRDSAREQDLMQRESAVWDRQEKAIIALEKRAEYLEEQIIKLETRVRELETERDHWRSIALAVQQDDSDEQASV